MADAPTNRWLCRAGRLTWVLLVLVAVAGLGLLAAVALRASGTASAVAGPFVLTEVGRTGTGHQRAERVAFADRGRVLAVTCPRYNRVVLYRVRAGQAGVSATESTTGADRDMLERQDGGESLECIRDVALAGRPVAVVATADRVYVLQNPSGDARHLEPGWWETLDLEGNRVGSRFVTGFYPDDLVLTRDGRHALVLTSGRAEGGPHRPAPALDVVALGDGACPPRIAGHLTFDGPADDPARLSLSASGECVAVTLWGSNEVAAVDLHDLARPRLAGRSPLPALEVPYPSHTNGDSILMPVDSRSEAVWAESALAAGAPTETFVACTLPHDSGLRLYYGRTGEALGELTLHGPLNMGRIRPTGLAFCPERGLIALATRSGSVHLIALQSRYERAVGPAGLAAVDFVRPLR